MTPESGQKTAYIIGFAVISIAIVGFFVGLQSPMNPTPMNPSTSIPIADEPISDSDSFSTDRRDVEAGVIPATHYADMVEATKKRSTYRTSLRDLRSEIDPLVEIRITPEQKAFALAHRDQNRAFNGAPPTIPHSVEQMNTQSCMACHGEGFKSKSLRISKMAHQFLANCTQCHVENNPSHMRATLFRENSFVGLPAPTGGPRAYQGAPPMIPHSTWMRVDCTSCHGFVGEQGIRTTHPWRQNCQQCHAPSSELEQSLIDSEPQFLVPPRVIR